VVFTHLIGDGEKTWHQCFRFAGAKGRGHRFLLSSVDITLGPPQASIKHNRKELAKDDSFDPSVSGVEDMGDGLRVGDPQAVLLSKASRVGTPVGREQVFSCLGLAYLERSFPTCGAAIRGQEMVLNLSRFSAQQTRHMSCNVPCSRVWIELKMNHRESEWCVPWKNEGFSGPGTSPSEILVYLRYVAYVAAAAPPNAAHCV
jgi:hypothetical protein